MFFGFWVPCEILRVTNIELPSFIPSSLYILNSQLLSRPHLIIGGTRSTQRACPRAKDKLFDPSADGELFVF